MASIVLLLLFLSKVYFSECCCAVGVWASGAVGASKVFLCVRIHEDVKAVVSFPETFHKRSTPGCTRLWDFEESSVCGGLMSLYKALITFYNEGACSVVLQLQCYARYLQTNTTQHIRESPTKPKPPH